MEQVSVTVCQFLEELLISCFQQLFERRQISCAVTDALAASLKSVDLLSVGRLDESRPSSRSIIILTWQ